MSSEFETYLIEELNFFLEMQIKQIPNRIMIIQKNI